MGVKVLGTTGRTRAWCVAATLTATLLVTSGTNLYTQTPAVPTLLKAGRLLDVRQGRYLLNQGVLIREGRISAVGALADVERLAPSDAPVVDLSRAMVLPGLIDAHSHLLLASDPTLTIAEALTHAITQQTAAKRVLLGASLAREILHAGFTTVRNLGHSGIDGDVALRDAIGNGWVQGPRIFASARKITPIGGQALPVQTRLLTDIVQEEFLVASSPAEGRRAVLENLRVGANVMKVVVDDGTRVLDASTLKAIVDESHRVGRKVAAHASSHRAIQLAVEAGVDSIEHANEATAEQLAAMRKQGIVFVPTVLPRQLIPPPRTDLDAGSGFDWERARDAFIDNQRARVDLAQKAGVKMAFGSDLWIRYPDRDRGRASLEGLQALETFGMLPADALRAATVNAAELLSAEKLVGTVEAGRYADLIALEGDPLEGLQALDRIQFVMKGGVVVRDEFGTPN